TTDPAASLSPSANFPVLPVIQLPCSADFSTGRGGFLQLLSMSLSPCCPYFPAEVFRRFSPWDAPCCLRLKSAGSAFRARIFEVTMGSLTLRPGDSLTIHKMALSIGFRIFSFLPSCYSSYGALTFTPVGLPPTVHASLRWTHTLTFTAPRRFSPTLSAPPGSTPDSCAAENPAHCIWIRTA